MYIQVKSSNGISLVPAETILFDERKIFLDEEISPDFSMEFIKKVMLLTARDSKKPIDVLINSPGGDVVSGLAIYDCIQASKTPIRLFCTGRAASMAAVILSCGNHGRYMLPHSEFMVHEPLLSNPVSGNASSFESIAEKLVATRRKMNEILAKHTGKTFEEMEKITSYDHYMTAEETVEYGFADKIVDFTAVMEGNI